ncbi:MAG: hypothetical protein VYB79_01370 [Chloroflexota bacterium]|nr:hypothetical protein [Chloroflexota bacterium]
MLSKRLVGLFMFLGPILAVIMIIIEEGFMSSGSTFAEQLKGMSDNYTLATITTVGLSIAMLTIFIGLYGLARSMQGENKPGSDLAGLAAIFALLIAGIFMVSLGIQLIATERESEFIKEGGDALGAFAISEAIVRSIFVFDGLVMLFLGSAILIQKNMSRIVGGLFTLFGVCVLLAVFSAGDNWAGMLWFVGFLGFPIITSATGFITLMQDRKST